MSSNLRSIEIPISMANIQDQIAALLYATGKMKESDEILEIKFGQGMGLKGEQADGIVPLTVTFKSTERMDLTEG